MVRIWETQTIIVDPFAAPVTNVNLDKNFSVLQSAILTNTVLPNGKRQITLGIMYNDGVVSQGSYSLETILVGKDIADVTEQVLADVQTMVVAKVIEHTIKDNQMYVTILTVSGGAASVNSVTTRGAQFDPSNPITTGIVLPNGNAVRDAVMVNVGSLSKTDTRGQGTVDGVFILVSEP